MVLYWVAFYSTSEKIKVVGFWWFLFFFFFFGLFILEWRNVSVLLCLPRRRNCMRASEAADCFPFVSLWMMASI